MAAQYATRIFATTFLVCLLGDFTSSFVVSTLFGGIINSKLSLLNPAYRPVGDTGPVTFPPVIYVIVAPNVGETTTVGSVPPTPPSAPQEVVASTVAPETVGQDTTTPVLEIQPTTAIPAGTPGEGNGEAIEGSVETELT
ncbi:uncharacterized protein LOC105209727 [Zeugodacus cucurbitae]|uniref:uncharacterized protein LOC105209727 n=1 Tax=Zeugodacus cucurbitae TaxID=28588 RepID=UPI0023D95030|nr:uncharacterized protein LOC105209727 [Zeugodacus cucurbitae]